MRRSIGLLAAFAWLPIIGFALEDWIRHHRALWLIRDFSVHARPLLGVPLLLLADLAFEERSRDCVERFHRTAGADCEAGLRAACRRANRLRRAWRVELLLLLLAVAGGILLLGNTRPLGGALQGGRDAAPMSGALVWHCLVSLPLFQFLLFRAVWRWGVWAHLMWRISRLDMRLLALHPDRCGGIEFFRYSVLPFVLVALAANTVVCAGLMTRVVYFGAHALDFKAPLIGIVVFEVLLGYAPLAVFAIPLFRMWRDGTRKFGYLASTSMRDFEDRWVNGTMKASFLDAGDASTIVDYGSTFAILSQIRYALVDPRQLARFAVVCALPVVPLLLTEVSVQDVVNWLARTLGGFPG